MAGTMGMTGADKGNYMIIHIDTMSIILFTR
jgi:hypothetical protein